MKSNRSMLVGILGGLVVGAALGVLFAPNSGRKTRKKLLRKGEDIAEKTGDAYRDLTNGVTKKFETLKREVSSRLS